MKRKNFFIGIFLGFWIFFVSIIVVGINSKCMAASTIYRTLNYFVIYYYGQSESSPDVQRIINALYDEAYLLGMSIHDLQITLLPLDFTD